MHRRIVVSACSLRLWPEEPKDFGGDRAAIESLRKSSKEQLTYGYAITWEQRNSRRMGMQNVPAKVTFPTQDDYVQFLDKVAEVAQFERDRDLIRQRCPELVSWMGAKPLKVIDHAGHWDGLLSVSLHLKHNPRPNCYLRDLPVVVDTKFVERHVGILSELLPVVAPMTVGTDSRRFETRFGFRYKQPLVRLRLLDQRLNEGLNLPVNDFATPLDQFQDLPLAGTTVLIVENEMAFLSLPLVAKDGRALRRRRRCSIALDCRLARVVQTFTIGETWIVMASRPWRTCARCSLLSQVCSWTAIHLKSIQPL